MLRPRQKVPPQVVSRRLHLVVFVVLCPIGDRCTKVNSWLSFGIAEPCLRQPVRTA